MTGADSTPGNILLIGPAWVGDMVMAHALVQLLVRRQPSARIEMVAPPATEPLARRMAGVAATHVLEVGHGQVGLVRRFRVARRLRSGRFDQAIVLPNTWKSALVPLAAGIARRTGWHGEARYGVLNDRRRLDPCTHPLMVERFMALGLPPGEPIPQPYPVPELAVDADNRQRVLEALALNVDRPVLALCPGAEYGAAKRWPASHYGEVARHALGRGRQVWLMGSAGEADSCERIRELAPEAVNLAGRTGLLDAVDLLSAAEAVVCNDSGLMHVAAAVGARVVAVFGSTSPDFTPPAGARAVTLRLALPCSPCFQRSCPLGHTRCLKDLGADQVIEALG